MGVWFRRALALVPGAGVVVCLAVQVSSWLPEHPLAGRWPDLLALPLFAIFPLIIVVALDAMQRNEADPRMVAWRAQAGNPRRGPPPIRGRGGRIPIVLTGWRPYLGVIGFVLLPIAVITAVLGVGVPVAPARPPHPDPVAAAPAPPAAYVRDRDEATWGRMGSAFVLTFMGLMLASLLEGDELVGKPRWRPPPPRPPWPGGDPPDHPLLHQDPRPS